MRFGKLPPVLVFHFKRFHWGSSVEKIHSYVSFPVKELDMTPYCDPCVVAGTNAAERLYTLTAVIRHHGKGAGFGHYTAYAKNSALGVWFHFDDSRVTAVSPEQVSWTQAYLLFYSRVDLSNDK